MVRLPGPGVQWVGTPRKWPFGRWSKDHEKPHEDPGSVMRGAGSGLTTSTRVTGLTFEFGLAFGKMLRQRRLARGQVGGEAVLQQRGLQARHLNSGVRMNEKELRGSVKPQVRG